MRFLLVFILATAWARSAEPAGAWPLEPIYQVAITNGKQRFGSRHDFDPVKTRALIERTAFRAVCTNAWPPGFTPIFAVERTNRLELRRRPPRGQENYTEPLFFGLPLDDEADARAIAGRWEVKATRGDSRVDCALELTVETNTVAGRFDQYSEYRFASLVGGTFQSNILQLRVEYTSDVYLLNATFSEGRLTGGTWRRDDNSELGTWKVERPDVAFAPAPGSVELYEWRRGNERRYTVGTATPGPEWVRSARPLCKVWPAE